MRSNTIENVECYAFFMEISGNQTHHYFMYIHKSGVNGTYDVNACVWWMLQRLLTCMF